MNRWDKAFSSSVGKKFVMGITGLLLCGFLAMHLAGNLLLYVDAETYNNYAHTLHEQERLVQIAEVGLVILFALHIVLAFQTSKENRAARSINYARKVTKIEGTPIGKLVRADTWMFISGAVVLGFLLLHLADFTLEWRLKGSAGEEPFDKAVRILKDELSFWVYLAGCVILGIHLSHGFPSAFQSLGLSHPKYDPLIKWAGVLFAILVGVGFASFPIWAGLRVEG